MNKVKYLSVVLFAAILAGVLISCGDNGDKENPAAEGQEAGVAMCDCVASYTPPADPTDIEAFMAYAQQLYNCLGVIAPYSDYIGLNGTMENSYGYDSEAAEPLYSVFVFTNSDFEREFKSATNVCMQAFAALFEMMEMMGGQ